ncbi:MAG: T9SS type A sorting domain-containing protein [Paludibacter sp.]
MKKITKTNLLKVVKVNLINSLKYLTFIGLGVILSLSTLSAVDYCNSEVHSTRVDFQTAYISCQSLGGNVYEFKFETINPVVSWNATGSNFYSEVNGIGGTQVSNNLVKSADSKTLTWTVSSTIKPNIYVGVFFVTFSDGEHQFNIPTDENFAAVCLVAGIPTLAATTTVSAITTNTATSGGNVTVEGNSAVTARGICWGTTTGPTVALATKTVDGAGAGIFTSNITGLSSGVKYYVRSYATNTEGTAYGAEVSFTTTDTEIPTAFSATKGAVTTSSVELLLNATDNSGAISYTVSYGAGPTVVTTTGVSGNQKSLVISALTSATSYTFIVTAKDASANEAANSPISVLATTGSEPVAPTPTVDAANVIGIYSDAYTCVANTFQWWAASSGSDIVTSGNNSKKITSNNCFGTQLAVLQDVSLMTKLHVDIYPTTATTMSIGIVAPAGKESKLAQTLIANQWNGFDISLAALKTANATIDLTKVTQVGFWSVNGTFYLDNILFYTGTYNFATSTSEVTASNEISCYPNPVIDKLTIKANSEISQVVVSNLLGQNVKSITVNGLDKTFDLNTVSQGNYFVTVKLANGQLSTRKIVKL